MRTMRGLRPIHQEMLPRQYSAYQCKAGGDGHSNVVPQRYKYIFWRGQKAMHGVWSHRSMDWDSGTAFPLDYVFIMCGIVCINQ